MTHSTSHLNQDTRSFSRPASRQISMGDKIFVRIVAGGRTIMEFMTRAVASMTELTGEARRNLRKYHGLCRLQIRNMSQGWSMEKPLMIYADPYRTTQASRRAETSRMLFPWETH